MPHVTVTLVGQHQIFVDVGDYYGTLSSRLSQKYVFNSRQMLAICTHPVNSNVLVVEMTEYLHLINRKQWFICQDPLLEGTLDAMVVDSVNGVAPTSAADLMDKIAALLG